MTITRREMLAASAAYATMLASPLAIARGDFLQDAQPVSDLEITNEAHYGQSGMKKVADENHYSDHFYAFPGKEQYFACGGVMMSVTPKVYPLCILLYKDLTNFTMLDADKIREFEVMESDSNGFVSCRENFYIPEDTEKHTPAIRGSTCWFQGLSHNGDWELRAIGKVSLTKDI